MKFILGAKDPEMDMIENILMESGHEIEYAEKNGIRCNPTNAYFMDNSIENSITIECSVENGKSDIDHHKKGDYGYDFDFRNFLEGSSIGQMLKIILTEDNPLNFAEGEGRKNNMYYFDFKNQNWLLNVGDLTFIIPEDIVLVAALDHSSVFAYKGLCLGVEKEDILYNQLNDLKEKFSIPQEEFEAIKNMLLFCMDNSKKDSGIIDLTNLDLGENYSLEYLLVRELALFKEEAIAIIQKNTTYKKLMLIGVDSEFVESFVEEPVFSDFKLEKAFGVPNRFYAGALIC